ncbi:Kinetochore Sim4 complex subunit Fta4 [Elaphomyces granulatus]|jgi:hypothetical protein
MASSRTISESKSSFIRSQIRILSERLEPEEGWEDYGPQSEDLSEKVVEEALQKLNAIIKQHNRVVYSSQAAHHIARQIESLYWASLNQGTRDLKSPEEGVAKGTDLSNHMSIEELPVQWEGQDEEEDKSRYQQLRARLLELDLQRHKQQRRLAQYKQLEVLFTAFKDPSKYIQPNLVTRDGELGQELDRMRMLVARVAGRVGQSRQMHQIEDPTTILPGDPNQKLAAVLDMAP